MPREKLTMPAVTEIARNVLLKQGNHVPTVIAEGSNDTIPVQIDRLADTHEGKLRQLFAIGSMLGESGQVGILHQIFMISEVWMSRNDKQLSPHEQVNPSDDPQRIEALMISRTQLEPFAKELLILEMIRNAEHQLTELKTLIHMVEDGIQKVESPLIESLIGGYITGLMNIK